MQGPLMTAAMPEWFRTRFEYRGRARVEFEKLGGWVEGEGHVRVLDSDDFEIEVAVASLGADDKLTFGLNELLTGKPPVQTEKGPSLGVNPAGNRCKSVQITCSGGRLVADRGLYFTSGSFWVGGDRGTTLKYKARSCRFEPASPGRPRYWVLALTNFLSGFPEHRPELVGHPLRMRKPEEIPADLSKEKRELAEALAKHNDRVVHFNLFGKPAFIERLPDYEKRKKRLTSGRRPHHITAVMVGEVPEDRAESWAEVEEWFPFDLLLLLGLTCGHQVGAAWIEFRGADQSLAGRVHINRLPPTYVPGHRALDGWITPHIGHLLEAGDKSPEFRESYLQVAAQYIVKGGQRGQTLEDKLIYFFRAFECFCRRHGTRTRALLDQISPKNVRRVHEQLDKAAKGIDTLRREASLPPEEKEALRRIAERTRTTPIGMDEKFGVAVVNVIEKYGFPDARIAENYLRANPRPDGKSWAALLSYYRGVTVHETYLDLRSGKDDYKEVVVLLSHLHDLLLRMILKTIGFQGTYSPVVFLGPGSEPVDWVKPTTEARSLGYGRDPTA